MGKLMDKVMEETKAYEEELRQGDEVTKPKGSNRKGGSKPQASSNKREMDWETIERLSKSFCTILEVPSLANRLDEHTFRELVSSQLVFFNCVNERYWRGEGGDE